jgi:hypothetical protein
MATEPERPAPVSMPEPDTDAGILSCPGGADRRAGLEQNVGPHGSVIPGLLAPW